MLQQRHLTCIINLRSSSLNIQDCKKHVSKSFPRGNYNHHSYTRMLTNISATRQSHNFPTFFLSSTRSMVSKLDEINATIVNNKSDVAVITESWLSTSITDDLMIPGFRSVRKDRPDNQRGGGLCTYIKETLDFIDLNEPPYETSRSVIVCCRSTTDVQADLQTNCRSSAEYLQNICRMSAERLQRRSATSLQICRRSADEIILSC